MPTLLNRRRPAVGGQQPRLSGLDPMTLSAATPVRGPIKDLLALGCEVCIDGPGPARWTNMPHQIFERLQPREIYGVVVEVIDVEKMRLISLGVGNAKHAIDFTTVAREREYIVAILGEPRPLRLILTPSIPHEGRTHRCIGRRNVFLVDIAGRLSDIEAGDAVRSHSRRREDPPPGPIASQAGQAR